MISIKNNGETSRILVPLCGNFYQQFAPIGKAHLLKGESFAYKQFRDKGR